MFVDGIVGIHWVHRIVRISVTGWVQWIVDIERTVGICGIVRTARPFGSSSCGIVGIHRIVDVERTVGICGILQTSRPFGGSSCGIVGIHRIVYILRPIHGPPS